MRVSGTHRRDYTEGRRRWEGEIHRDAEYHRRRRRGARCSKLVVGLFLVVSVCVCVRAGATHEIFERQPLCGACTRKSGAGGTRQKKVYSRGMEEGRDTRL